MYKHLDFVIIVAMMLTLIQALTVPASAGDFALMVVGLLVLRGLLMIFQDFSSEPLLRLRVACDSHGRNKSR